MKSISRRILNVTLYCLFLIAALMSVVALVVVNKISDSDSETILTLACQKEALRFNNEFSLLENSVSTISMYVKDLENDCTSEEEMLSDDFCNKIQDMTLSIANRTDGAMAVYFRYDPELTGNGTQGFFWSRDNDEEEFAYVEPTDILQYDKNDTEHVGWFYEPKEKGMAMWMSPYYNKNLDVYMISYVVPYYTQKGVFLGVIGMDIDFNKIVKMTDEVSLYKTGKINLVDISTRYIFSTGEKDEVIHKNLSTKLYNHITTIDKASETLALTDDSGKKYLTCVERLSNNMRLMLYVPAGEINAQRDYMMILFVILMAVSLVFTAFFMIRITDKIVLPLKKLTDITGKYAEGDWDEKFISYTGDEIQKLSESISIMAETTKSYIDKIHDNAMRDALTGLKNKNCYLSYIEKYKTEENTDLAVAGKTERVSPDDSVPGAVKPVHLEYAIVVFDINYLKKVNDNFGHEAGDELIKAAGRYICDVFAHSPVFRIGGDEYNAILENRDYRIKDALCQQFLLGLKKMPPIIDDIPLSISCGMASFPEDGASYDEVFQCADERMYECKKEMKAGRE